MSPHVHPIGIRRKGPKVADYLRCVGCGLSTLNRAYLACDKSIGLSAEEGGRLCFECADKLPVDTEPNCDGWMEALFPNNTCDLCYKKQDRIFLCAICHSKTCYSCALHESTKAFDLSGKDTAIICLDCCPESIIAEVSDQEADFCILCQSVHVPGTVPPCLDSDVVSPIVKKILENNMSTPHATNFTGVDQSEIAEPEAAVTTLAKSSSSKEKSEDCSTNASVVSVARSTPPHDLPISQTKPVEILNYHPKPHNNPKSTPRKYNNKDNLVREASALRDSRANSFAFGITPQISNFVNNAVQDAVLNMSNIQLKQAAEINALGKKLDGILSELSKINSKNAIPCPKEEPTSNVIPTQVEEHLIAETSEYRDIHGPFSIPKLMDVVDHRLHSVLDARERANNNKKHYHHNAYTHGYDYDDESCYDDSYDDNSHYSGPNSGPQRRRQPQNKAQNRAVHFQSGSGRRNNNNRNNNNRNRNNGNNGNKNTQKANN